MMDFVLSLVMLTALALFAGAWVMWRRGATRQATLMGVLAVVMLVNVGVWTIPDSEGSTPIQQARSGEPPR